jgi:hypothetical protein
MSHTLEAPAMKKGLSASSPRFFSPRGLARALRITFISGPYLLLTGQLSLKHASLMILLCAPAPLLWGMLTIPPLLFPFPEHNAYYEFARIVSSDPAQWSLLLLASACFVFALAMPASSPCPCRAE